MGRTKKSAFLSKVKQQEDISANLGEGIKKHNDTLD